MTKKTEIDITTTTAVTLATTTARQAADLAATAVKTATELASKTADTTKQITETVAVMGTNMEWVKKSLVTIEGKIDQMSSTFVERKEFTEVQNTVDKQEDRIRSIELNIARIFTWGSAAILLLGVVQFILGKVIK